MKLYRVSRTDARDPLKAPRGEGRAALEVETAQLYTDLIEEVVADNGIHDLYLSSYGPSSPAPSFPLGSAPRVYRRGDALEVTDLRWLVPAALSDHVHCMIRDWSCRFVFFTQDPVVCLGLRHEDVINKDQWRRLNVAIDDISRDLIETDVFDQ